MPIKEPLDANSRETIRETRNNLYTERGRPVKIHRLLTRVLELFLGNLIAHISVGGYSHS